MQKYDLGLTIMTPGNNANHTVRVHYFGIVGERRIDKIFAEFSGDTQKEAIAKAMQSTYGGLLECNVLN